MSEHILVSGIDIIQYTVIYYLEIIEKFIAQTIKKDKGKSHIYLVINLIECVLIRK